MSLSTAFDELAAVLRTLPNIKNVYREPVEAPSVFPFASIQPATGSYSSGSVGKILGDSDHNITVLVLVERFDLPTAVYRSEPYADHLRDALQLKPTLNGAVQIVNGLSYTFGLVNWAGLDMLGYTFSVSVDMNNC